jgi:hypothetical protein
MLGGYRYYVNCALINVFIGWFLTVLIYLKILFEGGDPEWYFMWTLNSILSMMFGTLAIAHDMISHPVMFRELTGW